MDRIREKLMPVLVLLVGILIGFWTCKFKYLNESSVQQRVQPQNQHQEIHLIESPEKVTWI